MPPPDVKSAGIRALWEGPARRREVLRVAAALQGGMSVLLRVQAGHAGPALDAVECQVIGKGRKCSRVVWDGHAYDDMGAALGNPETDWEAPLAEPPSVLALEVRDVPAGAAGGVVAGHGWQVLEDVLRFVRGMQGRREADRNTVVVACDLPMWGDVCKKVEKEVGLVVEDATVHGEKHVLEFLEACHVSERGTWGHPEPRVERMRRLVLAHRAEGSLERVFQERKNGAAIIDGHAGGLWQAQMRVVARLLHRFRDEIVNEWIARGLLPDMTYTVALPDGRQRQVKRQDLEFSWFLRRLNNEWAQLPEECKKWASAQLKKYRVLTEARNDLMHFNPLTFADFQKLIGILEGQNA